MSTETASNPLETLPKLRHWAVIGVSDNREKYGNKIYRDLRAAGYFVSAVNPKLTTVEGDPCYPNLSALPQKPDVVDVVVPPAAAQAIVEECIKLGIQNLWFQPGSEDLAAISYGQAQGLTIVHDACILIQRQEWED